jgi:hypothetical protein
MRIAPAAARASGPAALSIAGALEAIGHRIARSPGVHVSRRSPVATGPSAAIPPGSPASVAPVIAVPDHEQRIVAALCGAAAASQPSDQAGASNPAQDMLAVAESIAERGALDVDDLRQRQLPDASGTALLLRALPFGLATPLDRPRLRRDAYRYASAAGADEGTALVCVAAALVAADLLRFDPVITAIRVRQSLLEDAPMALLNRLTILDPASGITAAHAEPASETTIAAADPDSKVASAHPDPPNDITTAGADPGSTATPAGADPASEISNADTDPGAALQAALSVLAWTDCAGVSAVLARLSDSGPSDVAALAAALAGAASGACDVPVNAEFAERAGRVAAALASLAAAAVP